MANTGYKGYSTLEQYYTDNNSATGTTKANTSGDPDYVAPVSDASTCPPPSYITSSVTTLTWTYDHGSYSYYIPLTITSLTNWHVSNIPSGFNIKDNSGTDVNSSMLFYSGQSVRLYPTGTTGGSTSFVFTNADGITLTIYVMQTAPPSTIYPTIVNGNADSMLSWYSESASILSGTTTIAVTMTASYIFGTATTNYTITRNGHNAGSGMININNGGNSFNLTMTESAVAGDTITITINY